MAQNVTAACGSTAAHGAHRFIATRVAGMTARATFCAGNVDIVTAQDSAYDAAIAYAAERGREDGTSAAGWYTQDTIGGRTTGDRQSHARAILRGIDGGDPAVMDSLPYPDLSGQWADTLTGPALVADTADAVHRATGHYPHTADWFTDICDAYETAYADAAADAIATAARAVLACPVPVWHWHANEHYSARHACERIGPHTEHIYSGHIGGQIVTADNG